MAVAKSHWAKEIEQEFAKTIFLLLLLLHDCFPWMGCQSYSLDAPYDFDEVGGSVGAGTL